MPATQWAKFKNLQSKTEDSVLHSCITMRSPHALGRAHVHTSKITSPAFNLIPLQSFESREKSESVSHSVTSNSLRLLGLQPTRLLCPWNSPSKNMEWVQPFSSSGDLPNPGIEPGSPALQVDSLLSETPGKPPLSHTFHKWFQIQVSLEGLFSIDSGTIFPHILGMSSDFPQFNLP